ncbi:MAG: hypothetical protein PHY56_00290 [Candidatus Omnitrophica bacterium]|nr:hypothetical protein [Candidatus Omnitrophota bacterium]
MKANDPQKTPTKIKCPICLQRNPPAVTYMTKQPWGTGNAMHFSVSCPVCGHTLPGELNLAAIELIESFGRDK